MVGVLFLVSCSGDDGDAVPTTESSPAEVIEPAPGDAEAPLADGELPRLQDVVVPEWEPETRTEQLLSEIGLTELTPQQAVDVFALLYPEMPAATPSDLPVGQGLDASYAWMLIRSVMEELTPEQRALVEELDAGEPIGHIDADGTITEFALASDETTTQGLHGFAPAQPTAVWRRYLRLAQTVMADWRRHRPDLPTFAIFLDRWSQAAHRWWDGDRPGRR